MKREYQMRGRRITVEELDNVSAVKLTAEARGSDAVIRALGARATPPRESAQEQWSAFQSAGWVFVEPSEMLRDAMRSRTMPPGAEAIQRVYLHPTGRVYVGGERLTVRLSADVEPDRAREILNAQGLDVIRELKFARNLWEVRVRSGRDALAASVDLSGREGFLYAEPQFIEHIPGRFTPTDPEYAQQWHLNNTGQNGGLAGADVSAEAAWDMTRGAGIRLSVVDNGFDVTHEDIAAAITAESGFFQDDGMGGANYMQGLAGYPAGNHGTFCAGMAIARANNGHGGTGVANLADFFAVACLGDQVGTQATLARAIACAADPSQEIAGASPDDGADVISCSLGPNGADWAATQTLLDAIDFAVTNGRGGLGTPIFWAVTNGNFDIFHDEVCSYANVIAVGRSTRNDLEDNCGHGPELQFLATGVDVHSTTQGGGYGNSTGTSFAAPTAAGVGALVIAANPNLTWIEVRDAIRNTCDKIGGAVYDGAGHNDDYGFGRVNAARAVCNAGRVVTLDTPTVTFNDVPEGETTARAVVFTVITCQTATFQIQTGPSVTSGPGSFGSLPSPNAALPAVGDLSTRQARLWLSFTGQNDGDITQGEVTVRLVETGETWVIPISANTIAKRTVGVALVLDQSGSMLDPSGLPGFPHRYDVLKFAAPVFVNVLPEDNGVGIVAFDQDAYDRMAVQTVGPVSAFDPARATALGVFAAYAPNPMGMTAIGDGVEHGHNLVVATGSTYDEQALVVFTDGFETASKYLSDVSGLINERVFAIGLGTADQVRPSALTTLTNGTGGYLLLTGQIGPDDLFLLSKYYLQIVAGVTNANIVLDPEGAIKPGQTHRIPFVLNEADIGVDVILLGQAPIPLFRWTLETPAGDVITPAVAASTAGSSYVTAHGVSYYRLTLPVPIGVAGARSGKWHAVLTVDEKYYKRYVTALAQSNPEQPSTQSALLQQVLAHGVRYSLSVHSTSGLRLQGAVHQSSYEPGANLTVRGTLTEYGIPIGKNRAQVRAELKWPDGTQSVLTLSETAPESGVYEATTVATQAGVYRYRILANGKTLRGRIFTREQLASAGVWKGGDQPPPHDGTGTGGTDPNNDPSVRLCRLLACLLSTKVIRPELERRLANLGFDIASLRRCLAAWCKTLP